MKSQIIWKISSRKVIEMLIISFFFLEINFDLHNLIIVLAYHLL